MTGKSSEREEGQEDTKQEPAEEEAVPRGRDKAEEI